MKATKTWLSVLLALVLLLSCSNFAFAADASHGDVRATGACGAEGSDVNYILYSDGTLVISGRGAVQDGAFNRGDDVHWCMEGSLLQEIRALVIKDGVTEIGEFAFSFLQLRRIDFGNTVERIGNGAFYDTDGFEDVLLPDSVKVVENGAFGLCSNLKKIVFGQNVETVGDRALVYCRKLEIVAFLNKDTEIIETELPWSTQQGAVYHEEPYTIQCGTVYGYVGSTAEAYVAQHPLSHDRLYYDDLNGEHPLRFVPLDENGHAEPDSHGNCILCGDHIKDVCPWCGGQHTGGFFQKIIGWLHNLVASVFGAKY